MGKPIYLVSLYYRADVQSGANKRLECLLQALGSKPGVRVSALIPEAEVHGLNESGCRAIPVSAGGTGRLSRFRGWYRLVRALRALPRGIVISDLMPPVPGAGGHAIYQLVHDVRALDGHRGNTRFARLTALLYTVMLRQTRRIMTVSRASAERIAQAHARAEIVVVPNGLSEEYFRPVNRGERRYDVLCIGIFEQRKNYERSVRAIGQLVRERPTLRCLFVGSDGGTRTRVRGLIDELGLQENITVASQIGDESTFIEETYDQSRVYFSASLYEGFGMTLIEAAARGCKVVCSDIGPFRELALPGARYVDPMSVAAMHSALADALSDDKEYDYRFRERYSWQAIADTFLRAVNAD